MGSTGAAEAPQNSEQSLWASSSSAAGSRRLPPPLFCHLCFCVTFGHFSASPFFIFRCPKDPPQVDSRWRRRISKFNKSGSCETAGVSEICEEQRPNLQGNMLPINNSAVQISFGMLTRTYNLDLLHTLMVSNKHTGSTIYTPSNTWLGVPLEVVFGPHTLCSFWHNSA